VEPASTDLTRIEVLLPGRRRPRTRADRTREAILEATFELLRARGFAGTSIDAIAAAAGVSKTTIYASWRSKSELVVELLGRFADDAALTPDTGELREDLLLALRRLVEVADVLRGVAQGIVAEAVHDPSLASALSQFVDGWRRHEHELVQRSIERGLIPADIDEEIATDLVASVVYFRLLFAAPNAPADQLPERLVDPILRAWGTQTA
jgi:AcrR family transcriptional regulator